MLQQSRDYMLLIIAIPIIAPLFVLVVLLSWIFHKKSIFFSQNRLGVKQSEFKLYKFRSMVENAQSTGSGLYSYEDDNRITPFGKFLRRTSLDELPQILNVIKGNMSFVGPRPAVIGELDDEQGLPDNKNDRFNVKPGITGWAQIHGRDNLTWQEKIFFDLEYVSFSHMKRFFIDLYIIFYTPFYLFNFTATYEKRN